MAADADFALLSSLDRWRSQHESIAGQAAWAQLFLARLSVAEHDAMLVEEIDRIVHMVEVGVHLGVEELRAIIGPRRPGYVPPSPSYSDSDSDSHSSTEASPSAEAFPMIVPASPPQAKRRRRGDSGAPPAQLDSGAGPSGSGNTQAHVATLSPQGGGAERGDPAVDRGPHPDGVETIEYMFTKLGIVKALPGSVATAARDAERVTLVEPRPPPTHRSAPKGAPNGEGTLQVVGRRASAVPPLVDTSASAVAASRVVAPRLLTGERCVAAVKLEPSAKRQLTDTQLERQARMAAQPTPTVLALRAAGGRGHDPDGMADVRALMVQRAMVAIEGNEDGLGVTRGECHSHLQELLVAAQRAFELRYQKNTRLLDKSYWKFWREWTSWLGTPELRSNVAANSGAVQSLFEREVAIALGAFMHWVAENPQYKVESMMARLRGVARRHKAVGIRFVSLVTVVQAAEGLIQEQIDAHGADSLIPTSKEPLERAEIEGMLALPAGTVISYKGGRVVVGDNPDWWGVRVWISLFCTGGFRKEAVGLERGETFGWRKLSLHHLTYAHGRELYRSPGLQQLIALRAIGTTAYVTPCPCKNDTTGKKYANHPVPSAWHPTRAICFAREVIEYEIRRLVPAEMRKQSPLVLGPSGVSWSKPALDDFFKSLLSYVATPERVKRLSVHSFRVWLACALLAAGATPEQIMLLLRWSSDEARRLYARMGGGSQVSLLERAQEVSVDTVRSHTLLTATGAGAPATSAEVAQQEAGQAVDTALRLVREAQEWRGTLPRPTELPCVVDDDEAVRRVRGGIAELRAVARRADDALHDGSESDED